MPIHALLELKKNPEDDDRAQQQLRHRFGCYYFCSAFWYIYTLTEVSVVLKTRTLFVFCAFWYLPDPDDDDDSLSVGGVQVRAAAAGSTTEFYIIRPLERGRCSIDIDGVVVDCARTLMSLVAGE